MSLPLFLVLLLICCSYALWQGGAPERVGAGLLLGAYALGLPLHLALRAAGYRSADLGTAAIDVALLLSLTVLAWRSARYWPVWLAGWQAAAVVAHLAKLLGPDMLATGYAIQTQIWGYLMVPALAVATWRHRARVTALGADPSWKVPAAQRMSACDMAAGSGPAAFRGTAAPRPGVRH